MLRDTQHLSHMNTLTDTIRWLVSSTGRYANVGSHVTDMYYEHAPERDVNVKGTAIIWDVPVIKR